MRRIRSMPEMIEAISTKAVSAPETAAWSGERSEW